MIAYIDRWILLAALAGGPAATWPVAAHAQSLDQVPLTVPYALADALIPYAQRDFVRALELLAPLAEQENAVAQLKLGMIFSRGKVASPDHVAARLWFEKAAEKGQVEAQFELGRIYRDGLGTRVDGKVAVYWFERAAEKATPHAINALGELYLGHQDVSQDFAIARSGSCAVRSWEIPRLCTISAFSMLLDEASCRTRSRRSSGLTLPPTRELGKNVTELCVRAPSWLSG
jgi:TPR repeat protein